jgi:hypothetical protein
MVSRQGLHLAALGALSMLPGMGRRFARPTGGTDSARYCYSVWLRHLVVASRNGLDGIPADVAELGPGDSLGIGLAALLSGARSYTALDAVEHASTPRNLQVFDELVELFRRHEPIPDATELPAVEPVLEEWAFPAGLFADGDLETALSEERVAAIRDDLESPAVAGGVVRYVAPWDDESVLAPASVDLVFSQAVLEHVADLPRTYAALARWLRPGGTMTCQVDFKCHGTAPTWDGHWGYGPLMWRLIRGAKPFLLNREPLSTHRRQLRRFGFEIRCEIARTRAPELRAGQLARRFRDLTAEDRRTTGIFMVTRSTATSGRR